MCHQKVYIFTLIIGNVMYFLQYGCLFLDQVLKDIKHHLNRVNIAYSLYPTPIILSLSAITSNNLKAVFKKINSLVWELRLSRSTASSCSKPAAAV